MTSVSLVARPPWGLILAPIALAFAGSAAIFGPPDAPPGFAPVCLAAVRHSALEFPFIASPAVAGVAPNKIAKMIVTVVAQPSFEMAAILPQRNDTLDRLSRRSGVPLERIRALNPQLDGFGPQDVVSAGTIFVLPSTRRH